jgi:hypothetical protein
VTLSVSARIKDTMSRPVHLLRTTFAASDFVAGLLAGGFALGLCISADVRQQGVTILLAQAGVGVAVLGVVSTTIAIFATFFDGNYRRVLDAVGGLPRALMPYKVVAAVAALSVIGALTIALGWPTFSPVARAVLLACSTALTGWAVAGTVSLVGITSFHAEQRAELMRGAEDAESIRAKRLRETL